MVHEVVDLYKEFRIPREGKKGGYLKVFSRAAQSENRQKIYPAMLVIPGGGYQMLSEREGEPVALQFLARGYAAFILDYSVNTPFPTPLVEAGMAMAYIRKNAKKYFVDINRVAAIGFSAGGHLTGMLATLFDDESLKKALGADAALVRPDAVVLSYAVLTTGIGTHSGSTHVISGGDEELRKKLSLENCVTKESSPAFIWHTYEDAAVPVENALLMASAYRKAGVPFELHIFEKGWHGLSTLGRETHDEDQPAEIMRNAVWQELADGFLRIHGFCVKDR